MAVYDDFFPDNSIKIAFTYSIASWESRGGSIPHLQTLLDLNVQVYDLISFHIRKRYNLN